MPETIKQFITCEKRVMNGYRPGVCGKKSKVERNGKHYCGTHDPVKVAERDAKRAVKYAAERAANEAKWARDAAVRHLCEGVSTERLNQLGDGWVKLVLDSIEKAGYFGY